MKGKFPNGLAEAMAEAGVGPTELERLTGITKQDIYKRAHQKARLTAEMAQAIAPHLGVSPAKLLGLREVAAFTVPLGGRIGAGGAIDTSTAQDQPGVQYEIETAVEVRDAAVAYQVIGDSMLPIFEPDTVIICRAHTQDIRQHIGKRVAVGTHEHGRQLKIVHQGSKPDLFDLISLNQAYPTLRDVKVDWVARIAAIIPADEWKILEREAEVQNQMRERLKKPSERRSKSETEEA